MGVLTALNESVSPERLNPSFYDIAYHMFSGCDRGIQAPGTKYEAFNNDGKAASKKQSRSNHNRLNEDGLKTQQLFRDLFSSCNSLMATTVSSSIQAQLTSVIYIYVLLLFVTYSHLLFLIFFF
jgi:hypothetical protein